MKVLFLDINDVRSSVKKDSRNAAKNKIINIVKGLIIEHKGDRL